MVKHVLSPNLSDGSELMCDFGLQPVSNRFPGEADGDVVPHFPLRLVVNKNSGLVSLETFFPIDELKPRYDWLTCYEPEEHLDTLTQRIARLPGVSVNSLFGAYSFKDDSTLRRLENLGYIHNWRLDPVQDLGVTDRSANVETYQMVFTPAVADSVSRRRGKADVMIVRHVVEHAYDLSQFINAVSRLVKPGGYIVWELPDCERSLENGDCTMVWEEHTYYFTQQTFLQRLERSGLQVHHHELIPYPLENCIVAIVRTAGSQESTDQDCDAITLDPLGLDRELVRARRFATLFARRKRAVRKHLEHLQATHGRIAMFGAGHLSVAFLSLLDVADLIDFVIDDNPSKRSLRMPIGSLEIRGSDALYENQVAVCLLGLNPQNQPSLVSRHGRFQESGGTFLSIFPGDANYLEKFR